MSGNTNSYSFPILGILGLVFVTLKLAGIGVVATWSWWWVLAPFWGGVALMILFVLLAFLVGAVTIIGKVLFSTLRDKLGEKK